MFYDWCPLVKPYFLSDQMTANVKLRDDVPLMGRVKLVRLHRRRRRRRRRRFSRPDPRRPRLGDPEGMMLPHP